jgi:hypothetical protein
MTSLCMVRVLKFAWKIWKKFSKGVEKLTLCLNGEVSLYGETRDSLGTCTF